MKSIKIENEKLELENQHGVLKNNFEDLKDFLDEQNTIFEKERNFQKNFLI